MTKIAIIEDDPMINQMYRMKFESEGFDVQISDNGKSGIELVKVFQPNIILLDLQMPYINGDATLAEIRSHDWGASIPVLILTNFGEEGPESLKKHAIAGYIIKAEHTPRQVVAEVIKILESNTTKEK